MFNPREDTLQDSLAEIEIALKQITFWESTRTSRAMNMYTLLARLLTLSERVVKHNDLFAVKHIRDSCEDDSECPDNTTCDNKACMCELLYMPVSENKLECFRTYIHERGY